MNELKNSEEMKKANLINKTLQDILTNTYEVKWDNINDIMTSSKCQNFKMPSKITDDILEQAIKLKTKQTNYIYKHKEMFNLFSSFPAAEVLNQMISRINGESKIKFIHWSAHDGNILSLIGYLGCDIEKWPPYGAYITIELWKNKNTKQFFLQFRYNGKLLIPFRFSNSDVVSFDTFQKFVKDNFPDLIKDCNFDKTKFYKNDVFISEPI